MQDNKPEFLTDEQYDALNKNLEQVDEAGNAAREYLEQVADSANNSFPAINVLVQDIQDRMDRTCLHQVLRHGLDPIQAMKNCLEGGLIEVFLTGYFLAQQGHGIITVPAKEKPAPGLAEFN